MSKLRDIICENSTEQDMEHTREAFVEALVLSETAGDTFKAADSDINAMCRGIAKVYTSRINATLKKQFDNQTANDDFDEFKKDHLVAQLKLIRSELPGKTDYIFQQIAALIKK